MSARAANTARASRALRAVVLGLCHAMCVTGPVFPLHARALTLIVGGRPAAAAPSPASSTGADDSGAHAVIVRFDTARPTAAPLTASPRPGVQATRRRVLAWQPWIADIAQRYRIDVALMMAVMHVESAGHVRARSPKGALGLMQLMPATANQYGVTDPYDGRQNLDGAARMLRDLLRRYGRLELVLAAYNAGPGAVDRHGGSLPPYDETRRYVESVTREYAWYRTARDLLAADVTDEPVRQARALPDDDAPTPPAQLAIAPDDSP